MTKKRAFKEAMKEHNQEKLAKFGTKTLDEDMIRCTEEYLVDCLSTVASRDAGASTFDTLRHYFFHHSKKFELDKMPCTSKSIELHIKRAYLQTYKSKNAATLPVITLLPTEYSFDLDDDGDLLPANAENNYYPENFPRPCNCLKCSKATVCICRVAGIACIDFCNCKRVCRNDIL